jgi:hypothetical protein
MRSQVRVAEPVFEDQGVANGEPGDRYLNSHGRRVRALTEEEFQQLQVWYAVIQTGFVTAFAGITLAAALHFQQVRRTPNGCPKTGRSQDATRSLDFQDRRVSLDRSLLGTRVSRIRSSSMTKSNVTDSSFCPDRL